jgi:putative ABC transport system substrate-binding protein
MLVDMLPDGAESVAVIYEPHNTDATEQLPEIEAFAEQAGLDVLVFSTSSAQPETTDQALAEIPDDVDAIFLLKVWASSARWFQWAYEHRIPSSQDGRFNAPIQQPLMSYGPSSRDMGTRSANLADQILKGTSPGDLPMDYPDLIFSIDTALAEAMDFDVPQASLNLADEIVRSDLALYATTSPADSSEVTHVTGTGACAGQQKTMAGTFAVCITAPCETLLDSGMVSYIDKTDVAICSTQNLVGTCSTSAFDLHYYSGEVGPLQIGCGFQTGHWIEPQR